MKGKEEHIVLTFNATIDAIATEKYCAEHGIEGRLIPVPRFISASCGMAFKAPLSAAEAVEKAVSRGDIRSAGTYRLIL